MRGEAETGRVVGRWRRWIQWRLRTVFFVVFVAAVLCFFAAKVVERFRAASTIVMSVRLTAAGTVERGGEIASMDAMVDAFVQDVAVFRRNGMRTRLVIECFSDVQAADAERLQSVATEAGFEVVEIESVRWPTPEWMLEE